MILLVDVILQQEAPKRRFRWKLVIISIILTLLAAVLAVVVFFFVQSRTVDHYFALGNDKYDRSLARIDKGLDRLDKVKVGSDPADLSRATRRVGAYLPKAQSDLGRAIKAFKRMRRSAVTPWEKKTADLLGQSAGEAREGTRELRGGLTDIAKTAAVFAKIKDASARFTEAFVKTNEAITAGNEDRHAEAKQKAAEADSLFIATEELLTQAQRIGRDPDIARLIPAISKGRKWATGAQDMAASGEVKDIAAYNRLVQENNRLSDEVAEIGRVPVMADPREWLNRKLGEIGDRVAGRFNQADKLREKALALWRRNT